MSVSRIWDFDQAGELRVCAEAAARAGLVVTGPEYMCSEKRGRRLVAEKITDSIGERVWRCTVRTTQHSPGCLTVHWYTGGTITISGDVPENAPKAEKHERVICELETKNA